MSRSGGSSGASFATSLAGAIGSDVDLPNGGSNTQIFGTQALAVGNWLLTFQVCVQGTHAGNISIHLQSTSLGLSFLGVKASSTNQGSTGSGTEEVMLTITALITVATAGAIINCRANNPTGGDATAKAISANSDASVTGYTAINVS